MVRQTGSPQPLRGQIVLRIESLPYGGDGLARYEGKVVFVRGGLPGEQVRAEIIEDKTQYARARVLQVLEPSPERVRPRCPHFGACGGCQWQHLGYGAQVRAKTEIVREQLRRLGRLDEPPVRDTIPSPLPWAYRNHAEFTITPQGEPGFQAARSNLTVPIRECHVVDPLIASWLSDHRQLWARGKQVDVRVAGGAMAVSVSGSASPAPDLAFIVKGASLVVSPGSFFLANSALIETMVDRVLAGLDLRGGEIVLDAFCGAGLFLRFMAPLAGRAWGIEASPAALADARRNLAGLRNVELRPGEVGDILPRLPGNIDAAVVDPPRAGCGPSVVQALIDRRIRRWVYVSCDPGTLARDARQLIDGGYTLVEVQPIDLFPQTYHVETISTWQWGNADAP